MKIANLPPELGINIDERVFNDVYLPYLMTIYNYEVYYGGQGSGKSHFAAMKKVLQLTLMQGRNMVCLRAQKKDCLDSCWGKIKIAMRELKLERFWSIRESDHRMKCINGNQIYFDGVDEIENIKSFQPDDGNLTDVWYEEVSEEEEASTIEVLDGRIRDQFLKCSLILTFNPVSRSHWLFKYVTQTLKTRDALVLKTTHWDNKFASEEYHQKTERLKYDDPYRYQVYGLGEWGVTGQTVFNANKIADRLAKLEQMHREKPPMRLEFGYEKGSQGAPIPESFAPFKYSDGETWVYFEPKPKRPYVIGIDTAGEYGDDFYAAHVIDNITGEQVAVFHSQRDPAICALQIFGLGKYYNNALLVPEVNFDEYLIKKLLELKYRNIYQRTKPKDSYNDGYEAKLGFRTTSETRPRMLAELQEWSYEHISCINDVATLYEMLTFTRQAKKMKGIWWGAEAGAHDDLVMSLAIAMQGREQQSCEEIPDQKPINGFWFPEELEMGILEKRFSKKDVLTYKKKTNIFGSGYSVKKRREKIHG